MHASGVSLGPSEDRPAAPNMPSSPQRPGESAEEFALRLESWDWTRLRMARRYGPGQQPGREQEVLLSHGYFSGGSTTTNGAVEVAYVKHPLWKSEDWQLGDKEDAVRERIASREARELADAEHRRALETEARREADEQRRRHEARERRERDELRSQREAEAARLAQEAEQRRHDEEQRLQDEALRRDAEEQQRREEEVRRLRAEEERRWREDAAWRVAEAAQRRESCPYCADDVAAGDPYCRWCGTRLSAIPPVGDWRSPQNRTGFGECRLGFYGPTALRQQHNYGRPFMSKGAAGTHASWCFDFSGRAREADVPRDLINMQLDVQSALAACGYRIIGLSREQRWRVLIDIAIPQLGRSQVIEHIEWLVQTRSMQARDYSHAVREWEYDLKRLRY